MGPINNSQTLSYNTEKVAISQCTVELKRVGPIRLHTAAVTLFYTRSTYYIIGLLSVPIHDMVGYVVGVLIVNWLLTARKYRHAMHEAATQATILYRPS